MTTKNNNTHCFYDTIDENLNKLEKNIKKLRKEVKEMKKMMFKF